MTTRPRLRLPAVALLCLVASGLVLLLTRPSPGVATGLTRVEGVGASFAVGARWSPTRSDALLFYADPTGRPLVGLAGAVVADAGYCAGLPTSTRGFAGFATPPAGSAGSVGSDGPAAVRSVAAAWAIGVSGRSPPGVRVVGLRLGDGTPAYRATLRLRTRRSADPCLARRVVLDVVALGGGAPPGVGPTVFVLVRDVDPRGVGDTEAGAVVQSLRSRT